MSNDVSTADIDEHCDAVADDAGDDAADDADGDADDDDFAANVSCGRG